MQGSFRRGPVTDLRLAGPGSAKPELDWEATSLTLKVTALLEQKGSKTLGLKTAPRLPLKKYNHLPVGRPAMMTWDRSAAFWVSPGGHPGLSRRHQANLGGGGGFVRRRPAYFRGCGEEQEREGRGGSLRGRLRWLKSLLWADDFALFQETFFSLIQWEKQWLRL